jgi:hypothetical protein
MFVCCGSRKDRAAQGKKLKEQSTHPVDNPWHYARAGATKAWGYFGIVWPEVMHQTESGLMKRAIECIVELMQRLGAAIGKL